MKLTMEQLVLLNDVFNYALDLLESEEYKDKRAITFSDKTKDMIVIDWNKESKKIVELGKIMKPQIEVIEDENK